MNERKDIRADAADGLKERAGHAGWLLLAAVCWTALRFEFTRQWEPSSYERIYGFTAALPFGKRVLMPMLAHLLTKGGLGMMPAFQVLEIASTMALFLGLERVFRLQGSVRMSRCLGLGILAVLPWLFFVPSLWSLLFPWDLPAMAFTAWGVWAALEGRWLMMCVLMVFASANRESAILLPGVWVAVWAGKPSWKRLLGVPALLCVLYVLVQAAIKQSLADNLDFYELQYGVSLKIGDEWRLVNNWNWLTEYGKRAFIWLGITAGLPVVYAMGMKSFPAVLRRCGLVAWGYFWMLMVVGNIYEARIYCEIAVLLYVPATLWAWQRMTGENVAGNMAGPDDGMMASPRWLCRVEAACAIGVAAGVVLLGWGLSRGWMK